MNRINLSKHPVLHASVAAFMAILATGVYAQTQESDKPKEKTAEEIIKAAADKFQKDKDNLSSEKIWLKTDLIGVKDPKVPDKVFCIPNGARLKVHADDGADSLFRVLDLDEKSEKDSTATKNSIITTACTGDNKANTYTLYKDSTTTLKAYAASRSGVQFGALVVPFKYNLKTKKLDASPTIAPYLGYRTKYEPLGLRLIPVAMLGVSMKTGTNTGSGTQSGVSSGIGLRLTSSKNEDWQAGILFGRDFGGSPEVGATGTSTQGKSFNWFSAFLGYAM